MKIAFYTLGCKVNQYDTQMMKDALLACGHEITDFGDAADCYIVNTCTVTGVSDKKSRQIISRCKQKNKQAIVVVCGCFSQVSPESAAKITDADIILGTANRKNIAVYLDEYLKNGKRIIAPADLSSERRLTDEEITDFSDKTRAIVKIEDGCRNFCSYCIIPYARGPVRSKLPEQVIEEVKSLRSRGFREIVLTGIHLASYGLDLEDSDLADIIGRIAETGIERIRLGSLEPNIITEDFLDKIKNIPALMPSFHLSLQSGSDSVLGRMNRRYTTDGYLKAVKLLRTAFPNCAITTDIIVGFPGETEEEFAETLAFAETVSFAKIHIFPYSVREGTKAASMPDQIEKHIKNERVKRLEIVEQRTRIEFMKTQVGKTVSVLPERLRETYREGHTPNYLPIRLPAEKTEDAAICKVRVTRTDGVYLYGDF